MASRLKLDSLTNLDAGVCRVENTLIDESFASGNWKRLSLFDRCSEGIDLIRVRFVICHTFTLCVSANRLGFNVNLVIDRERILGSDHAAFASDPQWSSILSARRDSHVGDRSFLELKHQHGCGFNRAGFVI